MRKLFVVVLVVTMVFALAACGGSGAKDPEPAKPAEPVETQPAPAPAPEESGSANRIALVTNGNPLGVNDKTIGQDGWEAVSAFGDKNGISYNYFQPADMTEESYNVSFELAVNSGAEVIVAVGFQLAESTILSAKANPDVVYIPVVVPGVLADMQPNIYAVNFETTESGFLAGLGAVYEGYRNVGILSCYPIPPVDRYPFGTIQGVNWAAKELGLTGVTVKHHYTGTSTPSPEVQAMAASWYDSGTDVIACYSNAANASIFAASEAAQKSAIGCDKNQNEEASTILFSAVQRIGVAVTHGLEQWLAGTIDLGTGVMMTVDNGGTGLDMPGGSAKEFNASAYDAKLAEFKADKDGMRSSLIKYGPVTTIDELWNAIADPVITFTNIE